MMIIRDMNVKLGENDYIYIKITDSAYVQVWILSKYYKIKYHVITIILS